MNLLDARPAGATHVIQSRAKKRTLYLACARILFPPIHAMLVWTILVGGHVSANEKRALSVFGSCSGTRQHCMGAWCRGQHRRAWKFKSARFFARDGKGLRPAWLRVELRVNRECLSVDEGRRPWAWMGRPSSMRPASTRAAQRVQHTTRRKTTQDNIRTT